MSDFMCSQNVDNDEWYLKGNMSKELAAEVDSLLKDMSKVINLDADTYLLKNKFKKETFFFFYKINNRPSTNIFFHK